MKVKPCPICRHSDTLTWVNHIQLVQEWHVQCNQCGLRSRACSSEEEAIRVWNEETCRKDQPVEIKPCRHCGGSGIVESVFGGSKTTYLDPLQLFAHQVVCDRCGTSGPYCRMEEDAIQQWNEQNRQDTQADDWLGVKDATPEVGQHIEVKAAGCVIQWDSLGNFEVMSDKGDRVDSYFFTHWRPLPDERCVDCNHHRWAEHGFKYCPWCGRKLKH